MDAVSYSELGETLELMRLIDVPVGSVFLLLDLLSDASLNADAPSSPEEQKLIRTYK